MLNEPIDIASDTSLSSPEPLSLRSTSSATGQTPSTTFPTNFPNFLDGRYRELQGTSIPLRLDWNTFVAFPPLFGQNLDSIRLHNWALNKLQYRHDTQKKTYKIIITKCLPNITCPLNSKLTFN